MTFGERKALAADAVLLNRAKVNEVAARKSQDFTSVLARLCCCVLHILMNVCSGSIIHVSVESRALCVHVEHLPTSARLLSATSHPLVLCRERAERGPPLSSPLVCVSWAVSSAPVLL